MFEQPSNGQAHGALKHENPSPNKFCTVLGNSNCICLKRSTIPSLNYYNEDLEMFKRELGEILKLNDGCLIAFKKLWLSMDSFVSDLKSLREALALEDLFMNFLIVLNQVNYTEENIGTIKSINSDMVELVEDVLRKEDEINMDRSQEKYKEMREIIREAYHKHLVPDMPK